MPRSASPAAPSSTGIPGLDLILRGGLPSQRLYLIRGMPGTGKTTLAMQFLLTGLARGERVLYIALSETREEITEVARSHDWDLRRMEIFELSALESQIAEESQNTIFHPAEIELNKTTELILRQIESVKPHRLVIDSVSELRLLSDSGLRYRRQMLSFKQYFAGQKITALLLDDHGAQEGDLHVQSIAHGVITLELTQSDYGSERRRVRVSKLRGVPFVGGYHDADIVTGGLRVFPRLIAAEHRMKFKRRRLVSGIDGLDALLGGGLPYGNSCLFLGPAGAGKSTIALQFVHQAARKGEKALVCLFDENTRTVLIRSRSVNLPLEQDLTDGRVELMQIDPAELAPGQFLELVRKRIEAGVKVVTIDSLNGYMQAMPDARFLIVQLHELLSYLGNLGILTIMTIAQHGLVGDMLSPVDLTYLADAVVLLRFFEERGRMRKAISVVKNRIGFHESTIRELAIDKRGVRVGLPLDAFQGVLTGVPEFTGSREQMLTDQ
ncbi:MAG TPA: ATPase domain-containing protein [Opitutaceae bacterium]|nr:ATPase domain-containing protein [Opitutaceae bacterium]